MKETNSKRSISSLAPFILFVIFTFFFAYFLFKYLSLSTKKYSCYAQTEGVTFLEVVFPKSLKSLNDCVLIACIERSRGVFWSNASPV